MTLRAAAAAYYRSQFLNSVLPGGVLGDVHRGVTHRAMGSVVAERVVGQAVQVALAGLVVLVAWPVTASHRPPCPSRPQRSGESCSWSPPSSSSWSLAAGSRSRSYRRSGALGARRRRPCGRLRRRRTRGRGRRRDGAARGHRPGGPRGGGDPVQPGGLGSSRGSGRLGVRRGGSGRSHGGDRGRHVRRPRAGGDAAGSRPSRRTGPQRGRRDARRWSSMPDRPTSCSAAACPSTATSTTPPSQRLLLSNQADLERVDAVRAASDAILVGAQTVRQDNPRLVVRSARVPRRARLPGPAADPDQGDGHGGARLDPRARFFSTGETDKLVYCARPAVAGARERLGRGGDRRRRRATRPDATARRGPPRPRHPPADGRGRRQHPHAVPHRGLADELHLVVAPFFVGDSRAPRFVEDGRFPWNQDRRATLADVRRLGDVVLLRYALSDRYED